MLRVLLGLHFVLWACLAACRTYVVTIEHSCRIGDLRATNVFKKFLDLIFGRVASDIYPSPTGC